MRSRGAWRLLAASLRLSHRRQRSVVERPTEARPHRVYRASISANLGCVLLARLVHCCWCGSVLEPGVLRRGQTPTFCGGQGSQSVSWDRESSCAGFSTSIHIFVRRAAILRIRDSRSNRWAVKIETLAKDLRGQATVRMFWCPGYCGVYGYEMVDSVAEVALEKPSCRAASRSFSHIRRLVTAKGLQQ